MSRAKGTQFETAVVGYLRDRGIPCWRAPRWGARDQGDVVGVPGWTFEIKNRREIDLGTFMREAEVEAANAETDRYALIVKRRQKHVSEAYAVVPLRLLVELIGGPDAL